MKIKHEENEMTISEPERDHIIDVLSENIIKTEIFLGDLNKLKSVLKIISNVYHIKNIGEQIEKIEVIKKISDIGYSKKSFYLI